MSNQPTPYALAVGTVVAAYNPPELQVMLRHRASARRGGSAGDTAPGSSGAPGDNSGARAAANHFNLSLDIGQARHIQCNINVRSFSGRGSPDDPDLRYLRVDSFTNAFVLGIMAGAQPGLHPLSANQSIAYEKLISLSQMQVLNETPDANGETTLLKIVRQVIQPAFGGAGRIFVFGHTYADPTGLTGIHDVHMNHDANVTPAAPYDGLLVVADGKGQYAALFTAFDTQFPSTPAH